MTNGLLAIRPQGAARHVVPAPSNHSCCMIVEPPTGLRMRLPLHHEKSPHGGEKFLVIIGGERGLTNGLPAIRPQGAARHVAPAPSNHAYCMIVEPPTGLRMRLPLHHEKSPHKAGFFHGGERGIRTPVRIRGQIYSLLPLTTRPSLRRPTYASRFCWQPLCAIEGKIFYFFAGI